MEQPKDRGWLLDDYYAVIPGVGSGTTRCPDLIDRDGSMESRRFLLAITMMIATVVIVNLIFPPPQRQPSAPGADTATQQVRQAPPARATDPAAIVPSPATATPTLGATPVAQMRADTIVLQSPLYRYGISTRGAALVSAELLDYESRTREGPVQLAPLSPQGLLRHNVRVDGQLVDLSNVMFTPDTRRDVTVGELDRERSVRFRGFIPGSSLPIELTYTVQPDNYVIDVTARIGGSRATQLLVEMGPALAINEENPVDDQRSLAYVVNSDRNGIHSVPLRNLRKGNRIEDGPLSWVALKNKYFVIAAIPTEEPGFGGLIAERANGPLSAHLVAPLPVNESRTVSYRLYAGPQKHDRLVALNSQLEDVNPYGWRIVRPIIRPLGHAFTAILLAAHRTTGLEYGWVLILFGVAVRLALWPLNAKAMRSQMKGMELQPRIKDLQTRYKSDPARMQQELLNLYRTEKFNPMSGCLPMLLPMPVLITLFFVFQSTIEFRGVPFLWLPDLSRADPFYIIPILLAVTMFIQQWLSLRSMPPNPQAKMMLWFMPGFMLILFLNFASGLNLYYLAQNLTGFPQQMQLMKERQSRTVSKAVGVAR